MRRFLQFAAFGCLAVLPFWVYAQPITVLGVLYVGEESTIELPYVNEGSSPVTVRGAETSCECLVPRFAPTDIPAGETRALKFTYQSHATGRMRVDIKYLGASASAALKQGSVVGLVTERKLFLSSEQLRELQKSDDVVLVDLRRTDRFAEGHVPRSLNLPLFVLKRRADLKSRKLLLIDEGLSPASLAEEMQNLRQNGFAEIYALEGGVGSWIRAGGSVEGTATSALAASRIAPAEFLRAQKTDHWQVVNVADTNVVGANIGTPQHGRITPRVLIVASTDASYGRIENRHPANMEARVFYLAGGAKALATYQTEQTRMASNPGAVFQSKSIQPHVVANAGCGTCPKRP